MNKLLKLLLVAFFLFIILIGGSLVYLVSNQESITAKLLPQLEKILSERLNTPVKIESASLRVFPNTALSIKELNIGQIKSEALKLKSLNLKLEFLPLLRKQLVINQVSLQEPVIKLKTFTEDLERASGSDKSRLTEGRQPSEGQEKASAEQVNKQTASLPLKLNIDDITIKDGALSELPTDLVKVINALNFNSSVMTEGDSVIIKDLNFSAIVDEKTKLSASAQRLQADLPSGDLMLPGISLKLDKINAALNGEFNWQTQTGMLNFELPRFALTDLLSSLPFKINMPLTLAGESQVQTVFDLKEASAMDLSGTLDLYKVSAMKDQLALTDLSGQIGFSGDPSKQIAFKSAKDPLKFNFNQAPSTLQFSGLYSPQQLGMENYLLSVFGGSVKGNLELVGTKLKTKIAVKDLSIAQLLSAVSASEKKLLQGDLKSLNLDVAGDTARMPQTLAGEGSLNLANGQITEVNLAQEVLRAIKNIPFISGSLYEQIPESVLGELNQPNTVIRSMTADFRLRDNLISTDNLQIVSNIFRLEAKGTVSFDQVANLEAKIIFTPSFTTVLQAKIKEIKSIVDDKGQMIIPLRITGRVSKPIILPDVKSLLKDSTKKVIEDKINEEAAKLLKKAFSF